MASPTTEVAQDKMNLDPQSIFESIQANREHEVSVDSLRQIIDLTMRHLAADLRCLSTCRNLLSPTVARLPVEILARILWFVSTHHSDILRASHVCRHWRNVALENARLWSVIKTWNIDRTREFLRRSKGSMLDIEVEDCYVDDSCTCASTMEELEPHMHRVRSLDIAIERPWELDMWLRWLAKHSAPPLDDLSLAYPQECERYMRIPHIVQSNVLFQGNLSHLRSLELDAIVLSLPDPAPTFPHLTVLAISLHSTNDDPTLLKWLRMLKYSPKLRRLSIHNCAYHLTHELDPLDKHNPGMQVDLPILSELRLIKMPLTVIQAILEHVLLPVTCSLEFDIDNEAYIGRQPAQVSDYRDIGGVSLIKIIEVSRKDPAMLQGYTGRDDEQPLLSVKADQVMVTAMLESLSRCLKVSNMTLFVARSLDMGDWDTTLPQLRKLRELWINNSNVSRHASFNSAMRILALQGVCPQLRKLHFTQASLGTSDLQDLRKCVEKRSSHVIAGPLEEIELEGVPMWEGGNENDDLVHLRRLCPNVIVVH